MREPRRRRRGPAHAAPRGTFRGAHRVDGRRAGDEPARFGARRRDRSESRTRRRAARAGRRRAASDFERPRAVRARKVHGPLVSASACARSCALRSWLALDTFGKTGTRVCASGSAGGQVVAAAALQVRALRVVALVRAQGVRVGVDGERDGQPRLARPFRGPAAAAKEVDKVHFFVYTSFFRV